MEKKLKNIGKVNIINDNDFFFNNINNDIYNENIIMNTDTNHNVIFESLKIVNHNWLIMINVIIIISQLWFEWFYLWKIK